jgi:hypothetical protein
MASADYQLCDVCDRKAFYDADISDPHYVATYDPLSNFEPIGIAVLCSECNKTHEILVQPRDALLPEIEAECLAHDRAIEAAKVAVQTAIHEIYTTQEGFFNQEASFIKGRDIIATAAIEAYNAAMVKMQEKPKSKPHVTRMSDSSYYDEVCIACGRTDRQGLNGEC